MGKLRSTSDVCFSCGQDHKPDRDDELERIKRAGGMVIHKRVMGELAVSRAFGDQAFKRGIKVGTRGLLGVPLIWILYRIL